MRRHFTGKKSCPTILRDIELTDEIKEHIINYRIYHVPKTVMKCKTTQEITKQSNNVHNEQRTSLAEFEAPTLEKNQNGYIYVVCVREFLERDIYKIGRTADVAKRFKQYPKGSQLLFSMKTMAPCAIETELMASFKIKFTQRIEYGREYFEGDLNELVDAVYQHIRESNEVL